MLKFLLAFSLLFSGVSFGKNESARDDRGGGQTPTCKKTVQETRGKNDNHVTTRRVKAGPCGKPGDGKTKVKEGGRK